MNGNLLLSGRGFFQLILAVFLYAGAAFQGLGNAIPTYAKHGMVVSQSALASEIGTRVLKAGGSAVDAAVATAFALAVTHPAAGNIGGGGFMLAYSEARAPVMYDFRERAPMAATPDMWLVDGDYDPARHHSSHLAVGVPGTVAGLYMAWQDRGTLDWARLVRPAIELARDGIVVSFGLSDSLKEAMPRFRPYSASIEAFTNEGQPYKPGERWAQKDLAMALTRIAEEGPNGFYRGTTADLIVAESRRGGGILTHEDLRRYSAIRRKPIRIAYRDVVVWGPPPPSSGGVAIGEALNILRGYDLRSMGFGSSEYIHVLAESVRRAFADRARYLGDPDTNVDMPIERLVSPEYGDSLRESIRLDKASVSNPDQFEWPTESEETTHLSVIDSKGNAVSLTYTLEHSYGSGIVVPGAGFLLNNEMGDFNPIPGVTDESGKIGTTPNLAGPGKRMLSSMSPTIVTKTNKVYLVTGSPGGRTIINTVLQTILNVVDFEMNAQQAVNAGRIHHQWLPDRIRYERLGIAPDVARALIDKGHTLDPVDSQGSAQVIRVDFERGRLEGATDPRSPDGAAVGY